MKILCNYQDKIKEIYFDGIVCFHGSLDNLHELYHVVLNGLNGQDKTFLLNNQSVEKKELNLIEFDNNGIVDDLKFTSKSYFGKLIQDQINSSNFDTLKHKYELLNTELEEAMVLAFNNMHNEHDFINPVLSAFDIKNFIQENFSFINKNDANFANNSEWQLCVILKYIKNHSDQIFHMLIKDLDRNLDLSQILYIINIMKDIPNASFYIFLKCFDLYEEYNDFQQYMVLEDSILLHAFDERVCAHQEILTYDENICFNRGISYLNHKNWYHKQTTAHPEIFKSSMEDVILHE